MQFKSMVIANTEVSPGYFRMRLTVPNQMLASRPGQFIMVRVRDAIDPLLRRPFGIFDLGSTPADYTGGSDQPYLEMLYRVVGKGTAMLSVLHHGDHLDILGPLGKGYLTGAIDERTEFPPGDFRNMIPRFTADARKANKALPEVLAAMAARLRITPAQLALGWLLARKPWIVPIPGTRKLAQLTENAAAADVELSAADLEAIEEAAGNIAVSGARYPEAFEKLTGR